MGVAELTRRTLLSLGLAAGSTAWPMVEAVAATLEPRDPPRNPILGRGGVHHIAIRTRDWDRTLSFYQKALGFSVKLIWKESAGSLDQKFAANGSGRENDRWAYLDSGDGTCVEIFEDAAFVPPAASEAGPTNSRGGALVHFGLRTSQIDVVCASARAHGASEVGTPADFTLHTITGQGPVVVRICFIQGPNGEWIELLQNPP